MKTALVVDDSRLARISLTKILEKLGMQVDAVENGRVAIEFLKASGNPRPDIIFMDYLMPEMNGYEATKVISSNPSTSHIPVIICTSQEDEDKERQRALANGARGFIKKPITDEKVNEVIQEMRSQTRTAAPGVAHGSASDEAMQKMIKATLQKYLPDLTTEISKKIEQDVLEHLQKVVTQQKTQYEQIESLHKRLSRIEQFLMKKT
jgi:CheY-like chemotaxis protein